MSDQEPQKINRRGLLKIMAGLAPAGALAWVANKMPVKAEEVVIGVDLAEPGADETVITTFHGIETMITTGHVDAPFAPCFLPPGAKWAAIPEFSAAGFDERE